MGTRHDLPALPLAWRSDAAAELERITGSPEFRQSEQSKRLLRYLVEQSIEGNADALRERAIGTALFGLGSGYDTTENPIVRVRANEIRKRLAKYYQHAAPSPVRLEVPSGGYRVEFHIEAQSAAEAPVEAAPEAAPPRSAPWPWWVLPAVAGLALAALLMMRGGSPSDPLALFWKPAFASSSPVIICSGHPVVYRYSRAFESGIRGDQADHYERQTEILNVAPDAILHGRDIVPIPDQYIGLGSAEAVARIHGFLARRGKDSEIRFGNDLTFTELRKAPAVLIGAFQNRWTVEFTRGLRFVWEPTERAPGIRDTQTGKTWSLPQLQENGKTNEDYVVISRVLRSTSGEFVVAAAGVTQYGGRTVAEVLANPGPLADAVKRLHAGWESRNLQLLYHVKVIGGTTGPPELVAVYEW